MSDLLLNRSKEPVLHVSVAQEIKDMIVRDKMRPGDKLPTEMELMQMFSISRSTLRESMKVLKAENVITSRQGSGTFISQETGLGDDPLGLHFTDQSKLLHNLLETRMLIEPEIAALATQRATSEDIERLKRIVDNMYASNSNDSYTEEMDVRFHTAIAECTHNDVLIRVVPIINESIRRGHLETQDDEESFNRAKRSHLGIYQAIADRNYIEARFLAERHIWETQNDIRSKEDKT